MASTWTYIAQTTISTNGGASVSFSGFGTTYDDLVLVVNGNCTTQTDWTLRFNGDTASNYGFLALGGSADSTNYPTGIAQASSTMSGIYNTAGPGATSSSTYVAHNLYYIPNYRFTTLSKTAYGFMSSLGTTAQANVTRTQGSWNNTAAITSVAIVCGTWRANSTITLYGIKAA